MGMEVKQVIQVSSAAAEQLRTSLEKRKKRFIRFKLEAG
jgi:hypothetical protein